MKRMKKVKLPTDRTGRPIHVGDIIEWEDGARLKVDVLEWYGGNHWNGFDCSMEDFSDNLEAGIVVGHLGKKGKR